MYARRRRVPMTSTYNMNMSFESQCITVHEKTKQKKKQTAKAMAYLQDYKADNECKNTDAQVNKYRLITRHDSHQRTVCREVCQTLKLEDKILLQLLRTVSPYA